MQKTCHNYERKTIQSTKNNILKQHLQKFVLASPVNWPGSDKLSSYWNENDAEYVIKT